jgi:hypothetical protein
MFAKDVMSLFRDQIAAIQSAKQIQAEEDRSVSDKSSPVVFHHIQSIAKDMRPKFILDGNK